MLKKKVKRLLAKKLKASVKSQKVLPNPRVRKPKVNVSRKKRQAKLVKVPLLRLKLNKPKLTTMPTIAKLEMHLLTMAI